MQKPRRIAVLIYSHLLRRFRKLVSEIRMGQADEGSGAVFSEQGLEVHAAEFGNHVLDLGSGSGDCGSGSQGRHDPGDALAGLVVFVIRGGRKEGFAALGELSASYEVHLTAGAAELIAVDVVSYHLTRRSMVMAPLTEMKLSLAAMFLISLITVNGM